jgi:hypothetical protein
VHCGLSLWFFYDTAAQYARWIRQGSLFMDVWLIALLLGLGVSTWALTVLFDRLLGPGAGPRS